MLKLKKTITLGIVLSIICFLIDTFSAILGCNLIYRYFISGIFCFFMPLWFFIKFNQSKKAFYLFIIPQIFNLSVCIHSTYLGGYILPVGLILVTSVTLAYTISYKKLNLKRVSLLFVIFMILSTYVYESWIYGWSKKIIDINAHNKIEIRDNTKKTISLKNKKGKVLVLDVWASSCGICFKRFPEFEKQYLKYKNDSEVELYSLNLPLKGDDKMNIESLTKNYSFPNLYATSTNSWKQLNLNGVPVIIIIDKKGKIRFKGDLNTSKYHPYNNFNRLIEKFKNE